MYTELNALIEQDPTIKNPASKKKLSQLFIKFRKGYNSSDALTWLDEVRVKHPVCFAHANMGDICIESEIGPAQQPLRLYEDVKKSLQHLNDNVQKETLMCGKKRFQGGEKKLIKFQPRKPQIGRIMDNLFKSVDAIGLCGISYNNPSVEYEKKDKYVCCNEKAQWATRHRLSIYAGTADLNCRAFYGVPFVAELGVRIGVKVKIGMNGMVEPTDCSSQKCLMGNLPVTVYGALYSDALSGGASVQGGVKWKPRLQARQCFPQDGSKVPMILAMRPGNIELYYEFSGSWGLFIYEGAYTVYENTADKEVSLHIF